VRAELVCLFVAAAAATAFAVPGTAVTPWYDDGGAPPDPGLFLAPFDVSGSFDPTDAPGVYDWPVFAYDHAHSGKIPVWPYNNISYQGWYDGPSTGSLISFYGAPVESDGVIAYADCAGDLLVVNATTRALVWSRGTGYAYYASAPVIYNDRVMCILPVSSGVVCEARCYRLSDGTLLWQQPLTSGYQWWRCKPIVVSVGGTPVSYFVTPATAGSPSMVCGLNMNNGSVFASWLLSFRSEGGIATDGTNLFIPCNTNGMYKYTPAGALMWTMNPPMANRVAGGCSYDAASNQVFFSNEGTVTGVVPNVVAVNATTGVRNWF